MISDSSDIGSTSTDAGSISQQTGENSNRRYLAQEKRIRKKIFCPHCDQEVPKMFYRHKRSYYDSRAKGWATGGKLDREMININSSDEEGSGQTRSGSTHFRRRYDKPKVWIHSA